jgi:tRNA pseudouridine38-40 synthase
VHAEGQVAAVQVSRDFSAEALKRALNGVLPKDVVVLAAEPVSERFDPRRGAVSKLYRYCIWNGPERSPLRSPRHLEVPQALDVAAMGVAARALEGRHDFASFQAAGSAVECTVRTLSRCQMLGEAGSELRIECEGSGFLRHMVRNIAGTLLEVGLGRRPQDSMPSLLAARSRDLAGPTAAARGLTLVRVDYEAESV